MDDKEFNYQQEVFRTESMDYDAIDKRFKSKEMHRLLHAAIGMSTETGELFDNIKRHLFYGKDLDKTNLVEELGDLLWYVATACNVLGVTMEEVQRKNIAKLRKRYPQKFTEEAALNRDLTAERQTLES